MSYLRRRRRLVDCFLVVVVVGFVAVVVGQWLHCCCSLVLLYSSHPHRRLTTGCGCRLCATMSGSCLSRSRLIYSGVKDLILDSMYIIQSNLFSIATWHSENTLVQVLISIQKSINYYKWCTLYLYILEPENAKRLIKHICIYILNKHTLPVRAEVSKNRAFIDLANSRPCEVLTARLSSKSDLFPTRTIGILKKTIDIKLYSLWKLSISYINLLLLH